MNSLLIVSAITWLAAIVLWVVAISPFILRLLS